ncbi:alternative oxidase, mitochondrial-like [Patiria miniata]|uniref:Alternative oxidase n=1 Tax=Patiria miniata TaxID=46514 RepID=A0A914A494_PATMI|nr:alternative oxidase, mitochondrial-like [Patiria miniata]
MLKVTVKQASLLSANNLVYVWPRCFGLAVHSSSDSFPSAPRRPKVSPRLAAVPCRPFSLIAGGSSGSCTAGFALTRAVGSNVVLNPFNVTNPTTHQKIQSLSTASQQDEKVRVDMPAEDDKKEAKKHAPHFRIALKKQPEFSGDEMSHPKATTDDSKEGEDDRQYLLAHPIWSDKELDSVEITHKPPKGFADWFAYSCVQTLRFSFDLFSGYKRGDRTEQKWLIRIIFLETVAGVPGMVAAMTRHLRSLRRMQRDFGWIHTLLEEAENERMHLMTALELRKPGKLFTMGVLLTQGLFVNMFFLAYICSPRFCHRFVGYLEEEAVITYTKLIQDLDDGKLSVWGNMAAPDLAIRYWKMKPDAMMRDMILAIRADEAHHREVNHSLSDLKPDESNPFPPGQ